MQCLGDVIRYVAEPMATLFEHPDTPVLLLLREEDLRYTDTIQNLEASYTDLMAVVKTMDKPTTFSAAHKCQEWNNMTFKAEQKIINSIQSYKSSSCEAKKNELKRKIMLDMLERQNFMKLFGQTIRYVDVQNSMKQSRENYANTLATRMNLFTQSQLGSVTQESHETEFKSFINNEMKLLRTVNNYGDSIEAMSKVSDYYNNGKMITSLTEGRNPGYEGLEEDFARLIEGKGFEKDAAITLQPEAIYKNVFDTQDLLHVNNKRILEKL
ncbi:ORF55-like protein [Bufonid herpesvirus 1]|uniref:ORF55-like protein n=1 Tax=Bufonid herpesvirus 1 TaxID=2282206 RepID=UPI000EB71FD2|nr:ORF55-like protein [Bufonid herpesvirus 1]AXF48588.1 ORF55-like protein [Bufonid herpesvirus 1]